MDDLAQVEAQDEVDLIEKELTEKSDELEEKWQRYSQCLLAASGRGQDSYVHASLNNQKKDIVEAQAELATLRGARKILQLDKGV